jgi:ABC-2 type transport system ATP-binding protein
MSDVTVAAWNLTRRFGKFVAVDDVSLEVHAGEIYGFLGSNGAGKTTTIRMLCGLVTPSSGRAEVAGFDVARQTDKVKRRLGYMSQKFSLYLDLSVRNNLRFYGGVYGLTSKQLATRTGWALEIAELAGHEDVLAAELSGGYRQRLALACALLHEPPVVFLDEPTGGVDPVARRRFWDLIYTLSAEGRTVFVTTHFMDEAEHCHRIALMDAGKVVAEGSPAALKQGLGDLLHLEVVCHPAAQAMQLLRGESFVRGTSIFGTSVHVSTSDRAGGQGRVAQVLRDAGIEVERVSEVLPSLEDVFLHVLGKEEVA